MPDIKHVPLEPALLELGIGGVDTDPVPVAQAVARDLGLSVPANFGNYVELHILDFLRPPLALQTLWPPVLFWVFYFGKKFFETFGV
jgi:hypothetical protein